MGRSAASGITCTEIVTDVPRRLISVIIADRPICVNSFAALISTMLWQNKTEIPLIKEGFLFYGGDDGIRTRDLQIDNLTR